MLGFEPSHRALEVSEEQSKGGVFWTYSENFGPESPDSEYVANYGITVNRWCGMIWIGGAARI
jgi:hypothetical protein